MPDLLSPEGFDFAWTQYQGLMVEKLNLLTQGAAANQSAILKEQDADEYRYRRRRC